MRRFEDGGGRGWEVVVGRESWGGFVAIFVPRGDHGQIRQSMLNAESRGAASRELEELSPEDLRALLEKSEPKKSSG